MEQDINTRRATRNPTHARATVGGRPRGRPLGLSRVGALTTVAADLVLSNGYDALSLDAVIAQAGGSRRAIYSHFGGKEGLFVEAVTLLCHEVGEPLRGLAIVQAGGDPREVLHGFATSLLQIVLAPRTLALHRLMIAEGARFPQLARAIWSSGHESAVMMLADWIRGQQGQGVLVAGAPGSLATQFVDMVTAASQIRALIGLEADGDHDSIASHAVDTFFNGRLAT